MQAKQSTAAPDVDRTTVTETFLTLFGGTWLVVGLFVDGYAHSEIIDTETEDFFTPWHAIFYAGFAFSAAVVAWIAIRRSSPAPMTQWLPPGYGLAAVGLAIFAVGGIGDGIWHTLFGVENGIDALLSPTHLLLFVGMLLVLTAPLRAAWFDPTSRGTWPSIGSAISSAAITSSLCVFFFIYAFGLTDSVVQGLPFDPRVESDIGTTTLPDGSVEVFRLSPVNSATEGEVAQALSTAFVATVLLVVPVLGLLRRWTLPRGALTILWAVPVTLQIQAFDGVWAGLGAVLIGGVVSEATLVAATKRIARPSAIRLALGIGITTTWAAWMLLAHLTETIRWPPELWAGQILMSGFLATALALVVFPPAVPRASASAS